MPSHRLAAASLGDIRWLCKSCTRCCCCSALSACCLSRVLFAQMHGTACTPRLPCVSRAAPTIPPRAALALGLASDACPAHLQRSTAPPCVLLHYTSRRLRAARPFRVRHTHESNVGLGTITLLARRTARYSVTRSHSHATPPGASAIRARGADPVSLLGDARHHEPARAHVCCWRTGACVPDDAWQADSSASPGTVRPMTDVPRRGRRHLVQQSAQPARRHGIQQAG